MDITSHTIQAGLTGSPSLVGQSVRQTEHTQNQTEQSTAARQTDSVTLSPEAMDAIRQTVRTAVHEAMGGTRVSDSRTGSPSDIRKSVRTAGRRAPTRSAGQDETDQTAFRDEHVSGGTGVRERLVFVPEEKSPGDTSDRQDFGTPSETFVALSQKNTTENRQTVLHWANGTYQTQYRRANRFYFSASAPQTSVGAYDTHRAARAYAAAVAQGTPQTGLAPFGTGISRFM